jgi:esterase/lipase superfamily enzyme
LQNLAQPEQLQQIQNSDIIFVIGKEDPFLHNNHILSEILNLKGVDHRMHEWDGRAHRGRYWRKMVPLYL